MSREIEINVGSQTLTLYEDGAVVKSYSISTAKNGVGQVEGSEQTPLGKHRICQKIGADAEPNTVFIARVPTGEIYSESLANQFPDRDWILTRILWLEGLEPGINKGGEVDTRSRYVYIHGCPDQCPMGVPMSHGCIRMRNSDVIEFFDGVLEGDRVNIVQ